MLELLVFVPCEKVIISQADNNPTLIEVLHEISIQFARTERSSDAKQILIPFKWSIFTMWRTLDGKPADESKKFSQVIRILSPSGKVILNQLLTFTMEVPVRRVISHVPGFPTSAETGTWQLQVFLYDAGAATPKDPVRTYPLTVRVEETVPNETATA